MIPEEAIRDLRNRVNIVNVASQITELEERGKGDFWGLSPFKAEKTPSFHVLEGSQYFHCFSTNKRGDVFALIMAYEGISFPKAYERVREITGQGQYKVEEKVRKAAKKRQETCVVEVQTNGEEKESDTRTLEQRGHDMSFLKSAFELRECRADKTGEYWEYPTYLAPGNKGRVRRKFRDKAISGKKYNYSHADKNPEPCGYPLQYLYECEDGEVWVVNGEPSVWMCFEKGYTAFCALSESNRKRLPELVEALKTSGARVIHVLLDNDTVGRQGTEAIVEAAKAAGYELAANSDVPAEGMFVAPHFWESGKYKEGYDAADFLNDGGRLEDVPMVNYNASPQREEDVETPVPQVLELVGKDKAKRGMTVASVQAPKAKLSMIEQVMEGMQWFKSSRLFVSDSGEFYIIEPALGSKRPILIDSEQFALGLEIMSMQNRVFLTEGAIKKIVLRLQSLAAEVGTKCRTYIRIGEYDDKLYYDLGDPENRVIEISKDGWNILSSDDLGEVPLFFRKPAEMLPQVVPVRIESEDRRREVWNKFRDLLLPGSEDAWIKMVSYIIGCYSPPSFPYAGISINGRQGSGKSVRSNMLKLIVDPSELGLTNEPKDPSELIVTCLGTYMPAFENLSSISNELSDAFCRIATGATLSVRKLYTQKMLTAQVTAPLLVNGITDFIKRPDLRRRFMFIEVPVFKEGVVKSREASLWREFRELLPELLGCILDASAGAMRHFYDKEIEAIDWGEGLIDFGCYVTGAEKSGMLPWKQVGEFNRVYIANMKEAAASHRDDSLLVKSVVLLMDALESQDKKPYWFGDSIELHRKLTTVMSWQYVDVDDVLNSTYIEHGERRRVFTLEEAEKYRSRGVSAYSLRAELDPENIRRYDEYGRRAVSGVKWPMSAVALSSWLKREEVTLENEGIFIRRESGLWYIHRPSDDIFDREEVEDDAISDRKLFPGEGYETKTRRRR